MVVAAAAYDRPPPGTKERVAQLLALSKYPTDGKNNAAPEDAAKAAFMMAATAPDAARNTGFDDSNMHKYGHYIDIRFSPDDTQVAPN
jgi:hypothetical protein